MNERIRELFESEVYPSFAGTIGTGLRRNERGEYLSDNLEDHWQTFQEATELIVRECAGLLDGEWEKEILCGSDAAGILKQHFGVKNESI